MLRIIASSLKETKSILNIKRRRSLSVIPTRSLSFLNGSNANYVDDLYEEWKKDKSSVHKSWDLLFRSSDNGVNLSEYFKSPPTFAFNNDSKIISEASSCKASKQTASTVSASTDEYLAVYNLISSYQSKGHFAAKIDPLNGSFDNFIRNTDQLTLAYWGLNESHLATNYKLPNTTYIGGEKKELSLTEIISSLSKSYTSSIGTEFSHLEDNEKIDFIKKKLETPQSYVLTREEQVKLLECIVRSTMFEMYLAKKYPSEKRFGLEGCEVLISSLQDVIDTSAVSGVESFVIGMAHRGRLNVLANVCQQPLHHIFCRFNDELAMENQGSSDVKYHLGLSRKHVNSNTGKEINVSIVANPSHLEAVDPVVKGRVKAEQYVKRDLDGSKVMSILIHGDAAFSGQGVVYETINLSELKNFSVHGTIHVVSNNQIGFTTEPSFSRSSQYCTDVAKVVKAPIFHVNADDPEAVTQVSRIAAEYRNRFRKDVVIDLVSYRRNGHNEGDNPGFTQPIMYQFIANKPNVMEIYSKKLIESGVINPDTFKNQIQSYEKILDQGHCSAQSSKIVENKIWIDSPWKGFFNRNESFKMKPTGCPLDSLIENQKKCSQIPESFNLHPGIKRVFSQRLDLLNKGLFDWAMAEIAAFSSLLTSGVHVRLSGQDVERGTFSHRHHVLYDNIVDKVTYCPLNNLSSSQEKYSVCNSSLSEYGVLGFEHGYSMVSPDILTIWEGQFGDFANTAQCVIDQFITSGEDKWIRQSGMVMLLPHGFDGMGPEHSSARLERYLQLTKEDPDVMPSFSKDTFEIDQISASNYIVAYPTTPANIFHLLRRQMAFNFRKPLVVMSPKNLLRHEMARSSFSEIAEGTSFRRVIEEEGIPSRNPSAVKRLVFCSGKVYYELFKTRADKKLEKDVAIARIEQISPFPFDLVSKEIAKYLKADIMYVQEEPKNQGAYYHVKPMILLSCGRPVTLKYVGRSVSASPATGSKYQHNIEQADLLNRAFEF